MLTLAAGLVLGAAGSGRAEEERKPLRFDTSALIARPDPLIVGVSVHFGIGGYYNYEPDKTAALIREMGFTSVRDDLVWPMFDRPGLHENASPQMAAWRLHRFLSLVDLPPLLVFGHPHPKLPGGVPPLTDESREAFARFAVKAGNFVSRFKPSFEIWNQWNIDTHFNPPWVFGAGEPGDPRAAADYLKLLAVVTPAVRSALPEAPLFVGASGFDVDWHWTRAVYDGGGMRGAQGMSVHLSNHCDPSIQNRSATESIEQMSLLQGLIGSPGAPVPIYVSQVGWPTAPLSPCIITTTQQADYLAQFLLWSAATPWLKGVWLYEFKDQGRRDDDIEHNFGMFTFDYQPKPSACSVRETMKLLKGTTSFRLERPFDDTFVVQIVGGSTPAGKTRLVAWTTSERVRARLVPGADAKVDASLLCGDAQPAEAGGFTLGPRPLVMDVAGNVAALDAILTR